MKFKEAKKIYLPELIGKGYKDYWNSKARYCLCKGSRGSKKSKTTALWFIYSYYDSIVEEYKLQYGEGTQECNEKISALLLSTWNNKCVTDTYEPGSTAKILTTAIAIEEGLSSTTEMFTCTGSYRVSGWTIKCHKTSGHGTLSFAEALQQSCNPVMMKLSERIGISAYSNYFNAFGLSLKTGLDLPGEASPIFKTEGELSALDLAVYSFGQRFNVTAIELITAISSVANGGTLVSPHLIKEVLDDDGNVLASFGTNEVRQVDKIR